MSRHPGPTSRSVAEIVVGWALVLGTCRWLRLQGLGQIFWLQSNADSFRAGLDEVPAGLHENSTDHRHDPVSTEGEHDDRNRQQGNTNRADARLVSAFSAPVAVDDERHR